MELRLSQLQRRAQRNSEGNSAHPNTNCRGRESGIRTTHALGFDQRFAGFAIANSDDSRACSVFPSTHNSTPIYDVFLTSADVDSLAGLLHMREFQGFRIHSTPSVRRIMDEENSIFRVLGRATPPVQWFSLPIASEFSPTRIPEPNEAPRLYKRAVPVGGDYPDYVGEKLRQQLHPREGVVALTWNFTESAFLSRLHCLGATAVGSSGLLRAILY